MSNLRILHDNKLSATSAFTASSGTPANLLLSGKATVWQATGKTGTLTLTWASTVTLSMAALAFTNFSPAATMRCRLYTNAADPSPALDTTAQACCPYTPRRVRNFGLQPQNVNTFAYGGANAATSYFAATPCKKLVIDIDDSTSALTYLQAAALLVGTYWSPGVNADFGQQLGISYLSDHKRLESGDLVTDVRPQYRKLDFEFNWLKTEADRAKFYEICAGSGMEVPMFVSLFPGDASADKEQANQMLCKIAGEITMAHPKYGVFAAPLKLLEV